MFLVREAGCELLTWSKSVGFFYMDRCSVRTLPNQTLRRCSQTFFISMTWRPSVSEGQRRRSTRTQDRRACSTDRYHQGRHFPDVLENIFSIRILKTSQFSPRAPQRKTFFPHQLLSCVSFNKSPVTSIENCVMIEIFM